MRVFQVCASRTPVTGKARDCWKAVILSSRVSLVNPRASKRVAVATSLGVISNEGLVEVSTLEIIDGVLGLAGVVPWVLPQLFSLLVFLL
jgi:hypothetical protein